MNPLNYRPIGYRPRRVRGVIIPKRVSDAVNEVVAWLDAQGMDEARIREDIDCVLEVARKRYPILGTIEDDRLIRAFLEAPGRKQRR